MNQIQFFFNKQPKLLKIRNKAKEWKKNHKGNLFLKILAKKKKKKSKLNPLSTVNFSYYDYLQTPQGLRFLLVLFTA